MHTIWSRCPQVIQRSKLDGKSMLLGRKFKSNIIISTIYMKDNVHMHAESLDVCTHSKLFRHIRA